MSLKAKTAAFAAVLVVLFLCVGWYFESPGWTLSRMKAAAQANDADALNSYIDYAALREDFKAEIMARMMLAAQKETSDFSGLGMALGTAMVGPMIDGLVSPAGMRAALIANRNERNTANSQPAISALSVPEKPVIVRRSLSEFLVTTKDQPNSGMVFKLHGLSWKLSGVDLPPEQGESTSPLALVTTHMDRQRLENDNELLTVTGRVINPTNKDQEVPLLQAQLKTRAGLTVLSWTIPRPARTLSPGASVKFDTEVNVPPGGEELTIAFGNPQ